VRSAWRVARGQFHSPDSNRQWDQWMDTLYPASEPEKRRAPIRWARFLLAGHGLILAVSVCFHWWMLPVVTTLAPFYGGWLFFLCNNTQHIGLQDDVADFRLCCRTFTMNPFVEFLYWHMNYHTEHHMYAAVPCYNLARLHALIKHDLPPCPHGLPHGGKSPPSKGGRTKNPRINTRPRSRTPARSRMQQNRPDRNFSKTQPITTTYDFP